MNKNFQGVYPVVVTPFKEDGSFDFEASKKNLDALIADGVTGVCILGATGEYQSMSLEEHKAYVRELVPYVKDRISVIVGATRERPEDVVELMQNVKECGGHACMVLSAPYCHPSQEEIYSNYKYINDHVDLPLVVYNNPGSCGVSIERETFQKIFTLPNVAVVKESSGSMQKLTEVLIDAPDTVSVFCGCDNLAFESFADGAVGWISMLGNVAPKQCNALYEAVKAGDLAKGKEIYKEILPALEVLETFPKPVQSLKYLTTRKGMCGGYVRRPRNELTEEEKAYVVEAMRADKLA